MQVGLLMSTLQVVWSLPQQPVMLSSPRDISRSRVSQEVASLESDSRASRPYSASPRSPADRRTVCPSTKQLEVCA